MKSKHNHKYRYNHTQTGKLMLFVIAFVIVLFTIVLSQTGFFLPAILIMILIIIIISSFTNLNVKIDEKHIKLKFGYGLFQKKFPLKEIVSAKTAKNKWYYGWGIKVWFAPYMWIYNVSGFDAVEIRTKNKKIYRIGTDEPKKLEQAITDNIRK